MATRFLDLYRAVHSPIPAAVELLRHLFVSPSTILSAPLSNPVLQRLQWIPPSLDDVNESYLYFNNMIDHGALGRIHQLRLEMIHSGPSCWQVCKPEQVEYKVDEKSIQTDGFLCEIFARVTVWKNEDSNNNSLVDQDIEPSHKLGVILKLEAEEIEEEDLKGGRRDEDMFENRRLAWKYFDLQDLITAGIDTRPWYRSLEAASRMTRSPTRDEGTITDDQSDYWAGYSSSSSEESFPLVGEGRGDMDPILQARIQNTPLYRSKAPSVSSTNSTDRSATHPQVPPNLLSRISRTPLYKRAPSLAGDESSHLNAEHSVLGHLLKAAEIVNSPSPSFYLLPKSLPGIETKGDVLGPEDVKDHGSRCDLAAHPPSPPEARAPSNGNSFVDPQVSIKEIEDKLLDSFKSTFSFYKLSLDLLDRQNRSHNPVGPNPSFSIGERFVALAHRAVVIHHSS